MPVVPDKGTVLKWSRIELRRSLSAPLFWVDRPFIMKKFALTIFFILLASPAWATTHYLAPASEGGSDNNNGASASAPWLSPNHAVNCGDVILAAASTAYDAANFASGKWGAVTCSAGNNVAWLKCTTFDTCKTTVSGNHGMQVSSSYWGVQGWEVTVTGGIYFGCFTAVPPGTSVIHHIIFANDIANGCYGSGFQANNVNTVGVDYSVVVGSIAYNAAQGDGECYSGISDAGPTNSDSLPGTHVYIAGNFAWDNVDPNPCGGGAPTDGEGIIADTYNGNGTGSVYSGQTVIANNILVSNGGRGIQAFFNNVGLTAPIYIYNNTTWNNNGDKNQYATFCGEILLSFAFTSDVYANIAETTAAAGCGSNPLYAYYVGGGNSTDQIHNTWGWSAAGNDCGTNPTIVCGPNNTFSNPNFAKPTTPGAPKCAGFASVPACMATVIANFKPQAKSASGYGYQAPSSAKTYDPLFPQWLCNVNLPAGLVTMGCLSSSSLPAAPTGLNVTAQ